MRDSQSSQPSFEPVIECAAEAVRTKEGSRMMLGDSERVMMTMTSELKRIG